MYKLDPRSNSSVLLSSPTLYMIHAVSHYSKKIGEHRLSDEFLLTISRATSMLFTRR